jgi:hypothetical protein
MTWKPSPSLEGTDKEAERGKYADPHKVDGELDDCDDEPSLGSYRRTAPTIKAHGAAPAKAESTPKTSTTGQNPKMKAAKLSVRITSRPSGGRLMAAFRTPASQSAMLNCRITSRSRRKTGPRSKALRSAPRTAIERCYFGLTDRQKRKFGKRMSKQDGTTSVVVRCALLSPFASKPAGSLRRLFLFHPAT